MLHRLFQFIYQRKRSNYGKTYRKISNRSQSRDLLHYFHDFGDDGANSHSSNWLRKRIFKFFLWCIVLAVSIWFTYMSYLGLLIYDNWMLIRLDRRPLNGYRSSFSQISLWERRTKELPKDLRSPDPEKLPTVSPASATCAARNRISRYKLDARTKL